MVFVNVSDPVDSGSVANLARPGSNITGFMSNELILGGKWPSYHYRASRTRHRRTPP
jgi:putative ABC transport system substrate-binding protein